MQRVWGVDATTKSLLLEVISANYHSVSNTIWAVIYIIQLAFICHSYQKKSILQERQTFVRKKTHFIACQRRVLLL